MCKTKRFADRQNEYKLVILCTESTIDNVIQYMTVWNRFLQPKSIVIIAPRVVCNILSERQWGSKTEIIDEDKVCEGLSFLDVKQMMNKLSPNNLKVEKRVGWYFQQFLKMAYCTICDDESYLVWDSDTVPTHEIEMKKNNLTYFFDVKTEYHKPYFDTINKLFPDLNRKNEYSYISEHMIFRKDIMLEIISKIESNSNLHGRSFWEKILWAVDKDQLSKSGFSEFETYGLYVSNYYKNRYCIRNWSSLRDGTVLFTRGGYNKDFMLAKMSKKYDAITFEMHLKHEKMAILFSHKIFQNCAFIAFFEKVKCDVKKIKQYIKRE